MAEINEMTLMQQIEEVIKDAKKIAEIDQPAEMVQIAAVKRSPRVIRFLKQPSSCVIKAMLDKDAFGLQHLIEAKREDLITDELVKYAASKDGNVIQYLPKRYITEEVKMVAINNKPHRLASLILDNEASKELILCALELDPSVLSFLSPEIQATLPHDVILGAIKKDGSLVGDISDPSAEIQLAAVAENSRNILKLEREKVIPELQEVYQQELEKREAARERSLKSPSNTILRRTR